MELKNFQEEPRSLYVKIMLGGTALFGVLGGLVALDTGKPLTGAVFATVGLISGAAFSEYTSPGQQGRNRVE